MELQTGSRMMAGIQMSGSGESGFGITLSGFHCPTIEFGARLHELEKKIVIKDFVQWEDSGYITFIAMSRDTYAIPEERKIATFRREPHKFFQDLPKFLAGTRAQFIDRMVVTASMGSLSLTVLYRPVKSDGV